MNLHKSPKCRTNTLRNFFPFFFYMFNGPFFLFAFLSHPSIVGQNRVSKHHPKETSHRLNVTA
uniref:Uncharacterized protein n=1 Tax=Arundo donax TaxID=35708 RepID=A0A0A8YND1_ARUDO